MLADYQDASGIVVALNFNWFGAPFGLAGRWMTGGYTPYEDNAPILFSQGTLGSFDPTHPLMQGVTTLNAFFRHVVTATAGTTVVANWNDGPPWSPPRVAQWASTPTWARTRTTGAVTTAG